MRVLIIFHASWDLNCIVLILFGRHSAGTGGTGGILVNPSHGTYISVKCFVLRNGTVIPIEVYWIRDWRIRMSLERILF